MKKLLLPLLLSLTGVLLAGEKTFVIEEPFNANHGVQAVRFEETFAQPGTALESLGATVNGAPAFFQRRALETHGDGSVRRAEWVLWLHLAAPDKQGQLPEGAAAQFTVKLLWGGPEIKPAAFPGQAVTLTRADGFLIVNPGPAEYRIPDSRLVAGPKGPLGPIAAFRRAGDPNWYGQNSCVTGAKITGVKTEVVAEGPARVVVAVTYSDAEDATWRSELIFTAGSPVVQIEDRMEFSGTWEIDLSSDMAPDTQFACPWFDWESGNQRGTPSEKPLRAWKPSEIRGGEWPDLNEFFRLDPKWHDYQYMKGPYAWYYNKADRAEKSTALALFAWNMTRWHPTYQSRPRVYVQGEKKGILRVVIPLTGGAHTRTLPADDPKDPLPRVVRTTTAERSWGLAAFPVPDIKSAEELRPEALAQAKAELEKIYLDQIRKERSEARKAAEKALRESTGGTPATPEAVEEKMRAAGWPAGTDAELAAERLAKNPEPPATEVQRRLDRLVAQSAEPARRESLQSLVRFAHLPVSKLKDWVLTWPDGDRNVDRGIFRSNDDLVALQKEILAGKTPTALEVRQYIDEMKKTLSVTTDAKGKPVESVDSKFGRDWPVGKAILEGDASKEAVFVFRPPSVFRPTAGWIYQGGYTEGTLNPTTAPRGIRATIWNNSINEGWRKEGRRAANREMAAMAYIFSDPDFWPGRYYDWGIGNPNFHTDMHNIPGMVAAQLNTHPHADRWATHSVREIVADIARSSWQPGGGWTESPGYTGHAFSVFLPTAHAFSRSGLTDIFADPNFRAAVEFILNTATPPDRRKGLRGQAALGDSGPDLRPEVLRQAAMGYAKSDPKLAAELTAAAQSASGGEIIAPGTLGNTLATTDLSLTPDPQWRLTSRYYGGIGAFLRSRFGGPDEGFVTFKAGPARNHYQGDELSFTFWGLGDYLAVDYASFYNPRMNPDWTHNKVSFGLTASSPVATMMAFETTPEADLAVAENVNSSLQLMTRPYASARALWDYPAIGTTPKTNRRLLLYVKHPEGSPFADYLVVRDELSGQIRDTLDAGQIRSRLQLVVEENLAAVVRDAGFAPSQADELFAELQTHLQMLGADPATAATLVATARQAVVPGRTKSFDLNRDAPALRDAVQSALGKMTFSHEPRANLHLLVHDKPTRATDRLDFRGQMGTDLVVYVATGQDLTQANINGFGWGHNKRPADFVASEGKDPLPWNGGQWHSYRHGPVIGRDVRLPGDKSDLPVFAFGEMAQWVSVPFQGRDEMTMVLYPVGKGKIPPKFESLDGGKSVKVSVGGDSETITLATGSPVKISRQNKDSIVAASLPAIGAEPPAALVPRRSIEGPVDKPDDHPNPTAP